MHPMDTQGLSRTARPDALTHERLSVKPFPSALMAVLTPAQRAAVDAREQSIILSSAQPRRFRRKQDAYIAKTVAQQVGIGDLREP